MIPSSKAPETSRVNAEELARFRAGDEAVLARLVKEHGPALRRIAFRYGRMSFDEADDAVQETISRAWQHRATYAGVAPIASWLRTICRHVCDDMRRSRKRRKSQESRASSEVLPPAADSRWADSASGEWPTHGEILQLIDRLPRREREVVIKCCVEGKTGAETAAELACAPGTVWSALSKARRKLTRMVDAWRAKGRSC